jgi:hypothetical protein
MKFKTDKEIIIKVIGISRKEVASTIATTAVVAAAITPMETRYVLL